MPPGRGPEAAVQCSSLLDSTAPHRRSEPKCRRSAEPSRGLRHRLFTRCGRVIRSFRPASPLLAYLSTQRSTVAVTPRPTPQHPYRAGPPPSTTGPRPGRHHAGVSRAPSTARLRPPPNSPTPTRCSWTVWSHRARSGRFRPDWPTQPSMYIETSYRPRSHCLPTDVTVAATSTARRQLNDSAVLYWTNPSSHGRSRSTNTNRKPKCPSPLRSPLNPKASSRR